MIKKATKINPSNNLVFLISDIKNLDRQYFSEKEIKYIKSQNSKSKKELISFNRIDNWLFVQFIPKEKQEFKKLEKIRIAGDKLVSIINENKLSKVIISTLSDLEKETLALAEGMALGNYQFLKYKKDSDEKRNSLIEIGIFSKDINKNSIEELNTIIDCTCFSRTLVNEPLSYLTAEKLSEEFVNKAKESGASVEVLTKKKIESLKMGGLLAVNKGSIDPPTFTIIEWNPEDKKNDKPIVFVGKGVVFDTGGLNLKPGEYMNDMKQDMGGAATVAGAVNAIAKAKLPFHVIALIPATDNRPDGNAYVTGDVITMYDGTTVEVLNTDAEGRMILADALAYAKKYKPALVIDFATLTGSAQRAIGKYATVAMQSKAKMELSKLQISGENVYERIVEFPLWEEYGEEIKSGIADIKNLGGVAGGAITAGKFLEHFTDYPYIHMDIAGTAFMEKRYSYRGIYGTGVGVRLLFDFVKLKC
ncbi:MAG: leucyl aminopeptidase family protein [Bacteroidales bacterium]|nr:leucyl aminopeptidase family protein [Bacteroidales bacterium]